jgi:hypothetical protein
MTINLFLFLNKLLTRTPITKILNHLSCRKLFLAFLKNRRFGNRRFGPESGIVKKALVVTWAS